MNVILIMVENLTEGCRPASGREIVEMPAAVFYRLTARCASTEGEMDERSWWR
jgi:hypothetical protein